MIKPTEIFYSVEDGSAVLANLNDKINALTSESDALPLNLVTADDVQIPCAAPLGVLPRHGILKLPLNFVTADNWQIPWIDPRGGLPKNAKAH